MIRSVTLSQFPPFKDCTIHFPRVNNLPPDLGEVQLLSGANGTGKTRLLCLLAAFFGGSKALMARRTPGSPSSSASMDCESVPEPQISIKDQGVRHRSPNDWITHVPAFAYNGGAYVGNARLTGLAALKGTDRESCLAFARPPEHSGDLQQALLDLIVRAATEARGSRETLSNRGATPVIAAIENALKVVTGQSVSFETNSYGPEVRLALHWSGTSLPFFLLPDGLRSIIGWMVDAVVMADVWSKGSQSPLTMPCVFLLDEIESHLHPIWQRRVLPAFQRLFPRSQIIISTHSPFIISSLNCGWIHHLVIGTGNQVVCKPPLRASEGDSYVSVLETIMGVEEWFDPESEELLARFREARTAFLDGLGPPEPALALGERISARSPELMAMMGREVAQIRNRLQSDGAK